MKLDRKNVRTILLIIAFAVLLYTAAQNLASVYGAVRTVWRVFGVVITGLAMAFVLNVPLKLFENRVFYGMSEDRRPLVRKLRRPVSLVFALVVSLGLIGILIAVVLPQLTATVAEVAARLPEYISSAVNWLNDFLAGFGIEIESLKNFTVDWEKVFSELTTYLKEGSANVDGSSVVDTVTGVGTSVVSTVMNTFLGLVVAVYILAQKERIGRFTRRCIDAFLPQKAASGLARIASMASETFSNFVAGQLADSCILGILCYICMRIFRFPYPEVISVVIGVTSLVPMVGSFIGEVIGALLILIVSPLKALLFVVMVLAIQQVDGAFIYPRIVGRSVGLPGVAVFCAVIVGGNVAGVIGAMIGVPVCALIYALLREAVDARLRRREEKLV
ncbi:MAG: AI-2E family transporter [Lachnospiraceae bacterium]|jgi:predicted PurR-regulated permease PerM|uniref:AI-2E family transporter n=2 Tax=Candidatus Scatomorpha intestinigallinarum TaxID=2840923 RepID=A0A9D1DL10_9FIRM|nr:AI-2E family transporter [Candidatus Scatomorpha intestinigallinarum]